MIVLHTLGDALIEVGEKKIRPSSPLLFASLLYLATERGRRVPRAALQELFFPNSDERSGAHSLRQLLYKLRQLGAPLESDLVAVSVAPEHVSDDLNTNDETPIPGVEYLPDYSPEISERFSEWLEKSRNEVAGKIRRRLMASVEAHRDTLNWAAVERDAHLLKIVDPFNEVAVLALAEAAALCGRKAAALDILREYESETGRSDLRLPASLLRRRILHSVPDPVPALTALPFIGRDFEVAELRNYIARARVGRSSMYVIAGEAGIGKSRLLTEVMALAALEGIGVFTVRCQSHYANRPLSIFIELVPSLRAAPGGLGVSPESLRSLNALTSHTDAPPERSADARDSLTRSQLVLSAIRDLIDATAGEQTLLIAVEDAHWADQESLRALNDLVQGAEFRPVVIVCTTRTPEALPHSASTDDHTVIHRLKPLGAAAVTKLAACLLSERHDPSPGAALIEWSVQMCAGNPLLLQMLCSHYLATGEAYAVPADVLSAVRRRVEHLSADCRRSLALCALLGKHATCETLRGITGWDHLHMLDVIQRLEADGYLAQEPSCIRIAHDLVSQAVLSLIPPVSRRVMHACVATTLEQRYGETRDASLLWDCAEQWEQSGECEKAVQFLTQCARHARHIGRAGEALKLLTRAEALAQSPRDEIMVLRESVLAAHAARQWQATASFAVKLQHLEPDSNDHSIYELALRKALWAQNFAGRDSTAALLRCVSASHADDAHRVEAAHLLVCIAHETGNDILGHEAFERVEHLVDSASGASSHRTLRAVYHACFGDREEALRIVNSILRFSWRFDTVNDELRTALVFSTLLVILGDCSGGLELATQYFERSRVLGLPIWQSEFATSACTYCCTREDFEEARKWLVAAEQEPLWSSNGTVAARHVANRIELAIAQGNQEEAMADLLRTSDESLGDSLRGRAFFKSLEVRARQLSPSYQVDDATLDELRDLFMKTSRLSSADGLTAAYGEALWRRGLSDELGQVLTRYERDRREIGALPPSLQRLADRVAMNSRSTPSMSVVTEYAELEIPRADFLPMFREAPVGKADAK